jgi:hypothetical protein
VRLARALDQMPATADALASGEVSAPAVGVLVRARQGCEEAFAEVEAVLLEAARDLPTAELRHAAAYWRQAADPAMAVDDEERRFERRALHASPALDGMCRVDGDLDPEGGQVVLTALRAQMDADGRDGRDLRTPPQRRADALVEICRRWLDGADRPDAGGERPHVVVTVDLETLERRAPGRSELADTGPITPEAARRWACDAAVSRVITDARSVPLDLGRRTRVVPAALRRAVIVRDRTCRLPGCDRPPSWCDAHHVRHWAEGGDTALGNLILLCRRHHRVVHRHGFRVEMIDGQPVFTRPDASTSAPRAGPGRMHRDAPIGAS